MSGLNKSTERKYYVSITANTSYMISLDRDTKPNLIQFWNRGDGSIYISDNPSVSSLVYDKEISSGCVGKVVYPTTVNRLYLFSKVDANVDIKTYECDEIYSSDLDFTSETVIKTESDVSITYPETVNIYNISCTSADTEYSQSLPENCRKFSLSIQNPTYAENFRLSYNSGKVALGISPVLQYNQNIEYSEDNVRINKTLYFATSTANTIIQIIAFN
jgi:hypothetical protein